MQSDNIASHVRNTYSFRNQYIQPVTNIERMNKQRKQLNGTTGQLRMDLQSDRIVIICSCVQLRIEFNLVCDSLVFRSLSQLEN